MEQGFGPKLSRIVAGISLLSLPALFDYAFGNRVAFVITLSFLLLLFALPIAFPRNLLVKRFSDRFFKIIDIWGHAERFEDWLENFKRP